MDTLAALFREVGAPVSIERIKLDPPTSTEILVRIAAVGLCRTDYHVMRGERRVAMRPMVLGHEAAGVVEEVGTAVIGVKSGDHVVLTFIPGCGTCRWCQRGLHHFCAEGPRITQGPQPDGTYRRLTSCAAEGSLLPATRADPKQPVQGIRSGIIRRQMTTRFAVPRQLFWICWQGHLLDLRCHVTQ